MKIEVIYFSFQQFCDDCDGCDDSLESGAKPSHLDIAITLLAEYFVCFSFCRERTGIIAVHKNIESILLKGIEKKLLYGIMFTMHYKILRY